MPAAFEEPPYSNEPDVCTAMYANIMYTDHCVCRFVVKKDAVPIDHNSTLDMILPLGYRWRDEDLEINPLY